MVQNRTFLIFLLIPLMNLNYGFSAAPSQVEYVKSCELEVNSNNFDGSCLVLGLYALKQGQRSLFQKIDGICIDKLSTTNIFDLKALEPLISQFPRCYYIFKDQVKRKTQISFNAESELKSLVRFLNSN